MKIITKSDNSRRRVAAVGMYDGVHAGHKFLIDYLRLEASARGLAPSVITFSHHPLSVVRPLEAPGLLTSLEERLRRLGASGAEDIIILNFNDRLRYKSARDFLAMLHKSYGIDTLVLGFNNRFGHDRPGSLEEYRAIGEEVGVEVIPAPEYRGAGSPVSSSIIRRHLLSGAPEKAAEALGHPYGLRGIVVRGEQLGRSLGFPTANVSIPDKDLLIPKPGAYAAFVVTPDGKRRPAMVNIGFRPTVSDPDAQAILSIEAHILDYTGYLYDEEVTVEFIQFLRPERRFASVEKLREQLAHDAAAVRKILSPKD
ncbi:MAG: riboflavin biosynthesis protein RibF [Duncaniella sp.]|nr:riboflavin biosynthesis protein RibF [Duncaniella sp.]